MFSNAGHYIVVLGVKPNGDFMVFDVGDYPSKFRSAYRSALVKREGDPLVCSQDTLHIDTRHRSPNYYLFKGDENVTQQQFDKMMDDYLRRRGELPASGWAKDELASAVSEQLTDGSRPQAFVTRQEAVIMAARAGR